MESIHTILSHFEEKKFQYEFSICTLVTKRDEYLGMTESFKKSGFVPAICEFIAIDNTIANKADGYSGLNFFLNNAQGKYIIVCHQDILINKDDIHKLKHCLAQLDQLNSRWIVCGNAGAAGPNHIVYHISYPDGTFMSKGNFPVKVSSLDENFIIIKNTGELNTTKNLYGFHLYATDLVLQALLKGYHAYVINFNLTHKSRGNKDSSFEQIEKALINAYSQFFSAKWIQTNSTVFFLGPSINRIFLGNPFALFLARMFNGMKKRIIQ